jgi:hypothetical protein
MLTPQDRGEATLTKYEQRINMKVLYQKKQKKSNNE